MKQVDRFKDPPLPPMQINWVGCCTVGLLAIIAMGIVALVLMPIVRAYCYSRQMSSPF